MNQKFPASEKLKSKRHIDALFSKGKSLNQYPLKLVYIKIDTSVSFRNKTGVSVPKRNFKKAVERIYLKRLMREAYRKNKYLLKSNKEQSYALMFIYLAKETTPFDTVFSAVEKILEQSAKKENL